MHPAIVIVDYLLPLVLKGWDLHPLSHLSVCARTKFQDLENHTRSCFVYGELSQSISLCIITFQFYSMFTYVDLVMNLAIVIAEYVMPLGLRGRALLPCIV